MENIKSSVVKLTYFLVNLQICISFTHCFELSIIIKSMSLVTFEQQQLPRQAKLLQYASLKRIAGDFNDVTIQAGSESISANRMVLACYSKFFEAMFLTPLKEKYQKTVTIKDHDGKSVKSIIEYIYTGTIIINANNVVALLATANFLQVDDVKERCFNLLEMSLTVDSSLDLVQASILYNNQSCLQKAYQFTSSNFDNIIQTSNFKNLSKNELKSLLSNLDRNVVQESALYLSIINWIKHEKNREIEFSSFFLSLDLQKLPMKFVMKNIAEEPLVEDRKDCLKAVVSYFVSKEKNPPKEKKLSTIVCIGGDKKSSVTEIYNIFGKPLNTLSYLPCVLSNHCALEFNDCIYSLGGILRGKFSSSRNVILRLNAQRPLSGWKRISSMAEKRSDFGAAVWMENLVVAGGYNGSSKTNSAELYDPRLDRWSKIASLIEERDEHVLVAVDKTLFAIGGTDGNDQKLSSVEQLDNVKSEWKKIKPMKVQRSHLAAVTCHNFIFAIGGASQTKLHCSVEKYDYAKEEWSFVKSMSAKRQQHAACVVEEKIFVIGGRDEQNNIVHTIECYDITADEWTVVGETGKEFCNHAVVSI